MSKARLVITALFIDGPDPGRGRRPLRRAPVLGLQAQGPLQAEGEAAFEPRSRRPRASPTATPPATVELILRAAQGAGRGRPGRRPGHHRLAPGPAPQRHGLTRPRSPGILARGRARRPRSRGSDPKSSYLRFEADLPNETWQSDFTHYRLADRHRRRDPDLARRLLPLRRLHVTAHRRVTGPIVLATFRQAVAAARHPGLHPDRQRHGLHRPGSPAAEAAATRLETELRRLNIDPEELPPEPPHHLRQGRTVPTDPQEVAPRPTRPTAARSPSCRPCSTPSSTATTTTGRTARCRTGPPPAALYDTHAQSTPRQPAATPTPTTGSATTASTTPACVTLRHQRPPAPHRHRPNPRPNPRHPARPGPRTSASSTPPPANSSANSSSTPHRDYQPTGAPKGPTRKRRTSRTQS